MAYIPDCGDVIWLDFDPQSGHEQAGKRPALVLSPQAYNAKTSLAVVCPVTSQIKGYPFEVKLPENGKVSGVVLSDQIKSLDWHARNAAFVQSLPPDVLTDVRNKIKALLGL